MYGNRTLKTAIRVNDQGTNLDVPVSLRTGFCPHLQEKRLVLHYPVYKGAGFAVRLDQSGEMAIQPYSLHFTMLA